MKGIQLKLKGEWVALPKDFSLKLEQTNPLFNEQGVFSFPFEVPLEPNRFLFKNIADPFGDIHLKDIDGMEAELWFNGVMLYKGLVETDEEVEFEDRIPMTFLSGNADFMKRIESINAQDIPLDREIKLGYVVTTAIKPQSEFPGRYDNISLPEDIMMNFTEYNISNPYPISVFCNSRICASNEFGNYKKLEAKRPFSGVCFYVMYFLDLLFEHLKIRINRNDLFLMEDMKRLSFFTTKCDNYFSKEESNISLSEIKSENFAGEHFTLIYHKDKYGRSPEEHYETHQFTYKKRDVFATNKNFPDVLIKDIIDDFNNAFGVRFIQDVRGNKIDIVYLKEIFNDKSVKHLENDVFSFIVRKTKKKNINLSYGVSDNTSFNYDDYRIVKEYNGYKEILSAGISSYSRHCAIDKLTGNAYRVKVNKETGKNPSLFEVGGFRDYNTSHKSEDNYETLSINFSPVIVNDTTGGQRYNSERNDIKDTGYLEQTFAVFADVSLLSSYVFSGDIYEFKGGSSGDYKYGYIYLKANDPEQYDKKQYEESPLRTYNSGYTLGIMRGPGSTSKIEYADNYDEEGNASWKQTTANYAFTSDTCDNYGSFFDYNGNEAGGIDQTGRISLKLIAKKDNFSINSQYANRGLVSKFLSEYLYFLENRKIVILEVDMTITQLINIDFLKRYKIGDFVGFINKISYNMTVNGIEEVIIEMYIL